MHTLGEIPVTTPAHGTVIPPVDFPFDLPFMYVALHVLPPWGGRLVVACDVAGNLVAVPHERRSFRNAVPETVDPFVDVQRYVGE